LVGNKKDLVSGREVKFDDGKQKKNEFNLDGFCEISAKTGEGIEDLFKQISRILYNDIFNDSDIASYTKRKIKMVTYDEENDKKKCC
jgi:GTPase SAR1 family protein